MQKIFTTLVACVLVLFTGRVAYGQAQGLVADSTELRVLRELYTYTNGAQWTNTQANNRPWTVSTATTLSDATNWFGVTISAGDVRGIALPSNNLRGTLPTSLGKLTSLVTLALGSNQLSGPVPATLGSLSQLQVLRLTSNQFTGPLPSSLGQLTALQSLELGTNRFGEAAPHTLPAWLGSLTNLVTLDLSGNQWQGAIPATLGLPYLQYLLLQNNQLSGPLPHDLLSELWSLRLLYLFNNQLTGALPVDIGYCSQVAVVNISNNQFSGPLPVELGNLANLRELGLANNRFSGNLPASLGNCRALYRFVASNNQLSGSLPASIAALNFEYLLLDGNRFTGTIPAAYKRWKNVYQLSLANNQLSGPVPDSLKAVFLFLHNNHLSGELPISYATTRNWQMLLDGNDLTKIPAFAQPLGYPNLQLGITNNFLDFGSFEPNLTTPGVYQQFDYGQRTPSPADTIAKPIGAFTTIKHKIPPGGEHNVYQWERRVGRSSAWVPLAGQTSDAIFKGPLTEADEGEYRLRMTNTWVVGRILYSRSIYLTLLPSADRPFNEPTDGQECMAQDTASGLTVRTTPDTVNYVRSFTARVPLTDPTDLAMGVSTAQVQAQTTYLDGLGRPVQTVSHRASPNLRDIVQPRAYDGLGREVRTYQPYTAANSQARADGYHSNALRKQYDFHAGRADGATTTYTSDLPKTGVAYSEVAYEPSPLNRIVARGGVGEAWKLGNGHEHVQANVERPSVLADSVPRYQPGYGTERESLLFQEFYPDGALWMTEVRDEDFNVTRTFVDKEGYIVLRRTSATKSREMAGRLTTPITLPYTYRWLDTWYAYDDFGRLRATVPPLATQRVRANSYSFDGAGVELLLFRTHFDAEGRAIEARTPDVQGYTTTVFDALDRPILSQDAAQRAIGEWLATKYDALGRPVLTALVYYPTSLSRETLQAQATQAGAAPGARLYEEHTATGPVQFYSDQAFPALASTAQPGLPAPQVLTVTYYDDYDITQDGQPDAAYTARYDRRLGGEAPVADARVTGVPTRTLTRVLGSRPAQWLTSTTLYDEQLRPIQVQATNARGGTDTITTRYDFAGLVLASYARHAGGAGQPTIGVRDSSTYDVAGRLRTVVQQLDSQPAQTLLANRYNELGQLARQSLGGSLNKGLQNVDYGYTVRGSLARINHPDLADTDTGGNGQYRTTPGTTRSDVPDLWGFALHYDCGFDEPSFNGNIAGQRWRSRRDTVERAYGYRYDAANRLLQGDFVARSGPSQAWQGERSNHRMWGLGYDANGNLIQLRRRGLVQTGTRLAPALFAETDNLHYRYDPAQQGNRLKAVDDLAPEPSLFAASRRPERPDFTDVSGPQDYAYDGNGSLVSDQNKRLTSIRYNHLHLPEKLVFATGTAGVVDSLRFVYTATGQKVAKWAYAHGQPAVRTDYLGAWQYEADTLRWLSSAAGRALRQPDRLSGAITYNYEYSIKDHLGNLRVAFRRGQRQQWTASLEPGAASQETKAFDPASVSPPIASNQRAASGSYSAMLYANGTEPQPIGPTKLWAVQGGDTVRVEALANYTAPVSGTSWHFALPTFLAGYLSQPTPASNPDGSSTTSSFNWLQVGLAAGLSQLPSFGSGVPHAYLRLLVYKADSTVLADRIVPITVAARTSWEAITLPQLVLPTGAAYAQVYVANESNVPVWFDDVTIEHWQGLQVQENHYDPFGLELAGLSRSTPGLRTLNQYQWNGKEKQSDFGLGWTNLDWRFFDPQTGRFHTVDPLSDAGQEMWSTYQFGFDNAIRYNDPDGRCPTCKGSIDSSKGIMGTMIYGGAVSLVNLNGQMWAGILGTETKVAASLVYDAEGYVVDYDINKAPIGTSSQEMKSFGLDAVNVLLSVVGARAGGGALFEQASGKVAASGAVQAGKAAVKSEQKLLGPSGDASARVTKQIPANWEVSSGKKGGGTRFTDPNGKGGNSVRVMPENTKSPHPEQQRPYVKHVKDGKPRDVQGNALPDGNSGPAHIPAEKFKFKQK
jgi:RHS repeat-associated protein